MYELKEGKLYQKPDWRERSNPCGEKEKKRDDKKKGRWVEMANIVTS